MSKLLINSISVFLLFNVSALASDEKDAVCPISGEVIKDVTTKVEFKKGNVYFCTESCKLDFTKNLSKYASKGNFQLASTGQYVQTNCPVTGRKLKKNSKKPKIVNISAKNVELCCGGCMKKASKMADSEKFELLFSDKSFKKGFKVASK
tara:strand:- start:53 stop:502 length:450 start_codon:yes stop_codon:yes gene_type:complete